jgi:hypothetical protein
MRYLFGDPTMTSDERLEMNIFGRRQRLFFRGDFDPTLATGVDQTQLQKLVPVDRGQRVLRPLAACGGTPRKLVAAVSMQRTADYAFSVPESSRSVDNGVCNRFT